MNILLLLITLDHSSIICCKLFVFQQSFLDIFKLNAVLWLFLSEADLLAMALPLHDVRHR